MVRCLVIFSFLFFGVAQLAMADILFFDLNDNEQEAEAVQDAASQRGEKAINVPLVDEETRVKVRALLKAKGETDKAKDKICKPDPEAAECKDAGKAASDADWEYHKIANKMKKFGRDELFNAIGEVRKQGHDVSSIVISGHDGDRQFWGTFGKFDDKDLEDAMLANKSVAANVRSLYLWGCYTATTDDFLHGWKRAFPHTAIGGFFGQSPLGSRRKSSTLLTDMLVKERALLEARDRTELGRIFKSLADVAGSSAAMCVNSDLVVNAKGAHPISDDIEICRKSNAEEEKWTKVYECYFYAEAGCEDIPMKTDATNILRQAYDYAQKTKHCEEIQKLDGQKRTLTPLALRALLFDNYVRGSFETKHVNEINAFNELLSSLGLHDLQLQHLGKYEKYPAVGNMSRKEYLDRMGQIKDAWNEKMQAAKDAQGRVTDARIVAMGYYLDEFAKLQSGACIPGSWVEESGSLDDSPCGIRAGMQSAMSRAQAKVAEPPVIENSRLGWPAAPPNPSLSYPFQRGPKRNEPRASGQITGDSE